MKLINAALLLGLVACVGAAVTKVPQGCVDVHNKALSNLKHDEFYTGEWHLTHAKSVTDQNACDAFTVNGYNVTLTLKGQKFDCRKIKMPNARFTIFHCKNGVTGKKFQVHLSVLATDYNNYALVYRCGSHEGATKDIYQAGQRTKSQPFPTGLTSSLSSKGFKQSDFSYSC